MTSGTAARVVTAPTRGAYTAVAAMFVVNGTVLGAWVPWIPSVQAALALGDGALGVALLSSAVGAVAAMPVAARAVAAVGSRRVTRACAVTYCLLLPLPVLAPSLPALMLALAAFGAANGAMDVAMNVQGVGLERRRGRRLLSSLHGMYSLGGMMGALASGAAAHLGVGAVPWLPVAAALLAGAALTASTRLLPGREMTPAGRNSARRVGRRPGRWWNDPLTVLGVMAFCVWLVEGSVADWSAVYLYTGLGSTLGGSGLGFVAFSLTMAACRLGGDPVVARFGPVRTVRTGCLLAAAGLAACVGAPTPIVAVIGFGLVGVGVSNVVPTLFGAAGRLPGLPAGMALSAVAMPGYAGFLAGPPLLGFVAEVSGLRWAFVLVGLLCGLLVLLAPATGRRRASPSPRPG